MLTHRKRWSHPPGHPHCGLQARPCLHHQRTDFGLGVASGAPLGSPQAGSPGATPPGECRAPKQEGESPRAAGRLAGPPPALTRPWPRPAAGRRLDGLGGRWTPGDTGRGWGRGRRANALSTVPCTCSGTHPYVVTAVSEPQPRGSAAGTRRVGFPAGAVTVTTKAFPGSDTLLAIRPTGSL